jgi:3-hydroxyisobutyrate dehydrogenase-like beta-hydroxyacid dehydrogenase
MSDVTVIGLGNMGAALARALLEGGHAATVWNRSPEKAAPLAAVGARLAPSVAAAVASSPVVIVCLTSNAAANEVLSQAEGLLGGKVLVQLGFGLPHEARASQNWAHGQGASYLHGAITGSPASIGTPSAHIVFSGDRAAFDRAAPVLHALARSSDYKGEAVGLASAWEMALLMRYYGMFMALFHSVQICEAEGIPLQEFAAQLTDQNRPYEAYLCETILAGDYAQTSAPLELWAMGIANVAAHAEASGIDVAFPQLVADLFGRAMAAGYGRDEVSAAYEVLRRRSPSADR